MRSFEACSRGNLARSWRATVGPGRWDATTPTQCASWGKEVDLFLSLWLAIMPARPVALTARITRSRKSER